MLNNYLHNNFYQVRGSTVDKEWKFLLVSTVLWLQKDGI